jgi:hypothetical protein
MNLTYVHRPCRTDKPKTFMFVGPTWPMNVRHVVPQPPWCHVGLMFVGSPMNITTTWQTQPATSTPRGSYVHQGTDKHKDFLKKSCLVCLPGRRAFKTGIQYNIQTIANTYTIYNNPTRQTSQVSIQHHHDTSKSKYYKS